MLSPAHTTTDLANVRHRQMLDQAWENIDDGVYTYPYTYVCMPNCSVDIAVHKARVLSSATVAVVTSITI